MKYFQKGSLMKGTISFDGTLTDKQLATLQSDLKRFSGVDEDAFNMAILQNGGKLTNATLPNATGQIIETRRWGVIEVAQILRIPPHALFELSHGKWTSVQQMSQELIAYTFQSHIMQLEQELSGKLLTTAEQDNGFYVRIHTEHLLRGDLNAVSQQMLAEVNGGLRTPNEGRSVLELPDIGPSGDTLRIPTGGAFATGQPQIVKTDTSTEIDVDTPPDENPGWTMPENPDAQPPEPGTLGVGEIEAGLPGELVIDPQSVPPRYSDIIDPILEDACNRIEAKTEKATSKPRDSEWLSRFADEQSQYVIDAMQPLVNVSATFGKPLSLRIGEIAQKYSDGIKANQKENLLAIAKGIIYGQN